MSFRADPALVDEARGAVATIEQIDPSFSREVLLRRGLELVLQELRSKYNAGRRFKLLSGTLRRGQRRRA